MEEGCEKRANFNTYIHIILIFLALTSILIRLFVGVASRYSPCLPSTDFFSTPTWFAKFGEGASRKDGNSDYHFKAAEGDTELPGSLRPGLVNIGDGGASLWSDIPKGRGDYMQFLDELHSS